MQRHRWKMKNLLSLFVVLTAVSGGAEANAKVKLTPLLTDVIYGDSPNIKSSRSTSSSTKNSLDRNRPFLGRIVDVQTEYSDVNDTSLDVRLLASALQIRCRSMSVVISADRRRMAILGMGSSFKLSLSGSSDPSCWDQPRASGSSKVVAVTFYNNCNTRSIYQASTKATLFTNQVIITRKEEDGRSSPSDQKGSQELLPASAPSRAANHSSSGDVPTIRRLVVYFECAVVQRSPPSNVQSAQPSVAVDTSTRHTESGNIPLSMFIAETKVASHGFADAVPQLSIDWPYYTILTASTDVADMKVLPLQCYLSTQPDPCRPTTDSEKHVYIRNACPSTNSESSMELLSTVGGGVGAAQPRTSFTLRIPASFQPLARFFHLHCQATLCTDSNTPAPGQPDYIKCPPRDHCTGGTSGLRQTRSQTLRVKSELTQWISIGPLRPIEETPVSRCDCPALLAEEAPTAVNAAAYRRGQTSGRRQSSSPMQDIRRSQQHTAANGRFTMTTVCVIALLSFTVGMMLIGGIWMIHERTKPQLVNRRNNFSDSNFSSVESNIPCMTQTTGTGISEVGGVVFNMSLYKNGTIGAPNVVGM